MCVCSSDVCPADIIPPGIITTRKTSLNQKKRQCVDVFQKIIKRLRKILAKRQALVACWCWQWVVYIQSKLSQPSVRASSWQLSLARVREDLTLLPQQHHATAWRLVLGHFRDLNICWSPLTSDLIKHLTELQLVCGCASLHAGLHSYFQVCEYWLKGHSKSFLVTIWSSCNLLFLISATLNFHPTVKTQFQ